MRFWTLLGLVLCAGIGLAQPDSERGIPVTDPLTIAKCASCHPRDEHGNMQRISWERTTPEGWQAALKQMILVSGVSLTPSEARSIVKYLSTSHGLAPEEAKPLMYEAERRIHDETKIADESLRRACARCHTFARALSWRRSASDWKQLVASHAARYHLPPNDDAAAFLATAAPLHTSEWEAWSARPHNTDLSGRWLLTASVPGHGRYVGEMLVEPNGDDELSTSVHLTSVNDGSTLVRTGRSVVYGASSWRGRSQGAESGNSAPDTPRAPGDLNSAAREVLWIAPDQLSGEGRWFWGQYQEFGFDVEFRRPTYGPTLLALDRSSLKIGSQANRIRLLADHIPASAKISDLGFGPGVTVRRVVSSTATEVVVEVDVAAGAPPGKHDVTFFSHVTPGAIAVYDRVDYIKVLPDSATAAFGDPEHERGYQQFEAVGYQRGADGKIHTADDLELGPIDVTWSLQVFYAAERSSPDFVGTLSPTGFFTPAISSPNANFDVWVIATAKNEMNKNGRSLVGKSYMVVTVPTYTLNGRRYVRDLDRWIDDGPAQ